jgi:O-antigen ligase
MITLAYTALWVFIFSLPWENFIVIPGLGVISRVFGMLAASLAVLAALVSGKLRRWHLFHFAALLFVIWAGGTMLMVYNPLTMPKKFWTFVQLFIVVWMIWELAHTRKRQLGLFTAYILGAYVAALDTIMLYRRDTGGLRRFAAAGGDPNDLAMTLALALPMAWYLGTTYHRPLLRWVYRAYLPVGLVAIGLTASRGGVLAAIVGLLIVPLTMTKLSPSRFAIALVVLVLSGSFAVSYIPTKVANRLATTGAEVEDLSLGGRFTIWKAGVNAFVQRPLVGYGTSGFRAAVTPELGHSTQVAHNSFLSVLVEEGLVGFVFYCLMFVAVFLAVLSLPSLERRFALVLLVTVVTTMLPLTWEDNKAVWFVLAALLGFAQAPAGAPASRMRHAPVRAAPIVRSPMAPRPRDVITEPVRRARWDAAP